MTDDEKRELIAAYRKQLAAHSDPDEYADRNAIRANFADRLADALEGTLPKPEDWHYGWTKDHSVNGFVYLTEVTHIDSEAGGHEFVKKHGGKLRKRIKEGPWIEVPDE